MHGPSRRAIVALALCWLSAALVAAGQAAPTTERIVLQRGGPLAARTVLLVGGGQTFAARTDARGTVERPAVPTNVQLEALYLIDEQPSSRAGHNGWATRTYARGPVRQGRAELAQSLTLFNVVVSLEWQPGDRDRDFPIAPGCGPDSPRTLDYIADLEQAMRSASAYLYDLSDGQMAYGTVTIFTGGENWADADIRVLASNDYRPTAFVGGSVDTPTPFTTASGLNLIFQPGMIYLSRLWNGDSARCGPWSAHEGHRTIGHEWSHYALRLWDEYAQPDSGLPTYCAELDLPTLGPDTDRPSAMAYHYTSSEFWYNELAAACTSTDQAIVHGESDWRTLKRVYPAEVTLPAVRPLPGPTYEGTAAAALLTVSTSAALTSGQSIAALQLETPLPLTAQPLTFLLRPGGSERYPYKRILSQGALQPGDPTDLWGVQKDDGVAVQYYNWPSSVRQVYPAPNPLAIPSTLTPGGPTEVVALKPSAWQPEIQIFPLVNSLGNVVGLRVTIRDCDGKSGIKRLLIGYCPAGADCPQEGSEGPTFVSATTGGVFEHSFFFQTIKRGEPPARHGYIYARSLDNGEQLFTWYQLAGGVGPAHSDGHPPLLDGSVAVSVPSTTKVANTRVLFSPAIRCAAPQLPTGVLALLGLPIDVQVAVGERPWSPNDPNLLMRVSYNTDLVARLGISANDLVLLTLRPGSARWEEIKVQGRDGQLGWLSAQPLDTGATVAVAYRAPRARLTLPLVVQ